MRRILRKIAANEARCNWEILATLADPSVVNDLVIENRLNRIIVYIFFLNG